MKAASCISVPQFLVSLPYFVDHVLPYSSFSLPHWLLSTQFRAEAAGFDLGVRAIRAMGVDRASALSAALWRQFAPYNKRDARARMNMAKSLPALTSQEIDTHISAMWDNLGRTTAEAFHLPALLAEEDRFVIPNDIREMINSAKRHGAVFVSLHLGNWELAAPLAARLGLPVAGVYQRIRNPLIDARITAIRSPHYPQGLFPKSHETARRLLRTISEGGTATIMADLRDLGGVSVPFFGCDAPSTPFPALLARGRNVPLFAGAIIRQEAATFRAEIYEIPVTRTADRDGDLFEITAKIQAQFECIIRKTPGQWMWGHRRWER